MYACSAADGGLDGWMGTNEWKKEKRGVQIKNKTRTKNKKQMGDPEVKKKQKTVICFMFLFPPQVQVLTRLSTHRIDCSVDNHTPPNSTSSNSGSYTRWGG